MSPAIRIPRPEPRYAMPASRKRSIYTQRGEPKEPGRKYRDRVSLSVTVMADEKRAGWVFELQKKLGEGCTVTWDQRNDRHETGLRAILSHEPDATHHLVVQDDALVAENIIPTLIKALRFVPDTSPVGLYYGAKGGNRSAHAMAWETASRLGASWLARKGPIWGPGIVYPVSTIPALEKFYSDSVIENYDRRVMMFYRSIGADCFYSVPSLVDHRVDNNPSLVGHDGRGQRSARQFVGPQGALEVDWSGPVVRSRQ